MATNSGSQRTVCTMTVMASSHSPRAAPQPNPLALHPFTPAAAMSLVGMRLAIMDIYDVEGLRTGCGNRATGTTTVQDADRLAHPVPHRRWHGLHWQGEDVTVCELRERDGGLGRPPRAVQPTQRRIRTGAAHPQGPGRQSRRTPG